VSLGEILRSGGIRKMGTVMEIITKRYSAREYQDKPVEREKILEIVEAARLAPSTSNVQPWRFGVVEDPRLKDALVEKGMGLVVSNRWAREAPVIIVMCAHLDWVVHRLGAKAADLQYYLLDIGIAGEHMVLTATELGLGTCWIGWFRAKAIKDILNIPKRWKVVALLTLGYPREEGAPKSRTRLDLDESPEKARKPYSSFLGLQENNGRNDRDPPDNLKEKEVFPEQKIGDHPCNDGL
jgi:nitroreductase